MMQIQHRSVALRLGGETRLFIDKPQQVIHCIQAIRDSLPQPKSATYRGIKIETESAAVILFELPGPDTFVSSRPQIQIDIDLMVAPINSMGQMRLWDNFAVRRRQCGIGPVSHHTPIHKRHSQRPYIRWPRRRGLVIQKF